MSAIVTDIRQARRANDGRRVVLVELATGREIERWPCDAYSMVACGEFAYAAAGTSTNPKRAVRSADGTRRVVVDRKTRQRLELDPHEALRKVESGSHVFATDDAGDPEPPEPPKKRAA